MASISVGSPAARARLVDIGSASDLRRHLVGVDDGDLALQAERLLHATVKVESVARREAEPLRRAVEALGGGVVVGRADSGHPDERIDLLLSGNRRMFRLLASRLRTEQEGLDALAEDIVTCVSGARRSLSWGRRTLDFSRKTFVMGILNCTPDSFYPGSRRASREDAEAAARAMIDAGADIIDVGGESSRPGSDSVSSADEIARVVPVIAAIRRVSDVLVSIDTRKRAVAESALDAGADMVNDISALRDDPGLAPLVARRRVPVVLMHMRGTPKTMQENPSYRDTMGEILRELESAVAAAVSAGVPRELIVLDPGIGFGKRVEDNLRIIGELGTLRSLGLPILIGLSRKAFIGAVLDRPVERRLIGTVAANALAILNGADIVRVHDVAEAVEMVRIIEAIRGGSAAGSGHPAAGAGAGPGA